MTSDTLPLGSKVVVPREEIFGGIYTPRIHVFSLQYTSTLTAIPWTGIELEAYIT